MSYTSQTSSWYQSTCPQVSHNPVLLFLRPCHIPHKLPLGTSPHVHKYHTIQFYFSFVHVIYLTNFLLVPVHMSTSITQSSFTFPSSMSYTSQTSSWYQSTCPQVSHNPVS